MALKGETAVESLEAFGHPNITATHRSTFEVTKASTLTRRGECIIAVGASKGLADLNPRFRTFMRNDDVAVVFQLWVAGRSFTAQGYGCKALVFTHPTDIVCRKSRYICGRTLMILSDKAACDIPRGMVKLLQDPEQRIRVTIAAKAEGLGRR